MYKCKYFAIHELVCKDTYHDRGEKAWTVFDPQLLRFIDFLRANMGKATINDWFYGGKNQWRGNRTSDSKYFSQYSQHTYGRAFDIIFQDKTAEEVRIWLKENVTLWQEVTGIMSITVEEGVGWLHIDLRNNPEGYNSFYP